MSDPRRLVGTLAALLGTYAQLSIVAATIDVWGWCEFCGTDETGPYEVTLSWQPYVDQSGGEGAWYSGPGCPQPRGSGNAAVRTAPLPQTYDPHGYPGREIFACVKLRSDGRPSAAYLPAGTGDAAMDGELVRQMKRHWRFSSGEPGWHRVRLNSGHPPLADQYLRL